MRVGTNGNALPDFSMKVAFGEDIIDVSDVGFREWVLNTVAPFRLRYLHHRFCSKIINDAENFFPVRVFKLPMTE